MCPSRFSVDLVTIDANLALMRARHPGRAILLPVKANAYGHGLESIARHVQAVGSVQWLGVAEVSEAEQLRGAGIELPILKFSPCFPDELERAIAAGLTLCIGDAAGATAAQEAAERAGVHQPVHLKIDTGMRRVGVHPDEAVALAKQIKDSPNLTLDGVFTHLPVSDSPEGQEYTRAQLDRFLAVVDEIRDVVGRIPYVHAGNSGAVLGHDLAGTNLIRPGIAVYGYATDPVPGWEGLRPIGSWTSRISFLKRVSEGETVGYGRTWTAPRDTWIATVPVGYGDGYSRLFSNRGRMLVGGRSYPVVGRVCMDQTMIDLGSDDPEVAVGDEVVLLGSQDDEQITMEELADLMGTITYEVPCLIAPRVPRLYV
jgi:alanine racemase